MQLRSPNLTHGCVTMSLGNPFILGSIGQKSRSWVTEKKQLPTWVIALLWELASASSFRRSVTIHQRHRHTHIYCSISKTVVRVSYKWHASALSCLPENADTWRDVQNDRFIAVQELFIADQLCVVNEDHDGTTDDRISQCRLVDGCANVTCQWCRRDAEITTINNQSATTKTTRTCFFASSGRNHRQYSLCVPRRGDQAELACVLA